MQLLKPVWISSEGQSLMSIDIHPDGTRFVTGGQGENGSGRISVWNLKPVIDELAEKNKDVPKILAQMEHHEGCVNCVRWSFSGQMLASGGDDKVVMIWKKSAYGGGGSLLGSKVKQIETWRIDKTLRGHDGDILDLAWGPGDALLATASVDNNVVIWNAERFPDQIRVLRGHTGLVKGVIFDPVGKYLASQSDDRTLRIWKTDDWSTETVIKDPFSECGATTHVLRPGWSPEGSMLVSAHAMNGGGPTAQVVERGSSWKTQRDFVGHKKAVSCVRFCPSMLEKMSEGQNGQKTETFVMVALGSRDRSFSVWTSSLQRPLFVIEDVFDQSVIDIAWSKDGKVLLSCSMDGSVAACVLTKKEIGRPYSDAELHALMVSKHGKNVGKATLTKNLPKAKADIVDKSALVIENPEMLKATNGVTTNGIHAHGDSASKTQMNGVPGGGGGGGGVVGGKKKSVPRGPTDKQIEARTADGRRRITPIFIPPNSAEFNDNNDDNTFGSTEFGSSSRKGKSDIAVEIVSDSTTTHSTTEISPPGKSNSNSSSHSLMSERIQRGEEQPKEPPVNTIQVKKAPGPPKPNSSSTTGSHADAKNNSSTSTTPTKLQNREQEEEEVTSSKKKRKRILSSSSSDDDDGPSGGSPPKQLKPSTSKPSMAVPSAATVEGNEERMNSKKKRIRPDVIGGGGGGSKTTAATPSDEPLAATQRSVDGHLPQQAGHVTSSTTPPSAVSLPVIATAPPLVSRPLGAGSPLLPPINPVIRRSYNFKCRTRNVTVAVTNNAIPVQTSDPRNSHLHCAEFRFDEDPTLTWRTVFTSAVAAAVGGTDLVCLICADGSLHIYSSESKGEKVMPQVQLPSSPTKIHLHQSFLSIVTVCGNLFVWDLDSSTPTQSSLNTVQCLVSRENIEHLLLNSAGSPVSIVKLDHISRSDLCDHRPLISTSAGKSYAYSKAMQAWMKVTDSSSLIQTASRYSKTTLQAGSSLSSKGLPLSSLCHAPSARVTSVQKVSAETMHAATLAHCQEQKAAARILGSVEEFKFWTLNHFKELCQGGGDRNSDLIRSELGELRDPQPHPLLSKADKKGLLGSALGCMKGCLSLQRLFAEFEELEKSESDVNDLDSMLLG